MTLDLTVVTCTMNSSLFIRDLLESIKSQSTHPKEHVFVDANSSDDTISLIQEYKLAVPFPVVMVKQEPNGIASAMNLGAIHASSRYLMHLHSDDKLYSADSLCVAKKSIEESSTKWLFARCEYIDMDGKHIALSPSTEYSRERLLVSNFISHPSVIISKELFFDLGGFDESLKIAMDYDLWLRASSTEAPTQIDRILSSFRVHDGGTSSGNEKQMWREDLFVRLKHQDRLHLRLMARIRFAVIYSLLEHPNMRSKLLKIKDLLQT